MSCLFVEAVGAEEIPTTKRSSPDTYLVVSVGSAANSQKTPTFSRSSRPEWNFVFSFIVPSLRNTPIKVILFSYDDFSKDESLSELFLQTDDFEYGAIHDHYYNMSSTQRLPKGGRVHLKFQIAPRDHIPFTPYTGKIPAEAIQRRLEISSFGQSKANSSQTNTFQSSPNESTNTVSSSSSSSIQAKQKHVSKSPTNSTTAVPQTSTKSQQQNCSTEKGGMFMIPMPDFTQSSMPNGYQAVVYVMPTTVAPESALSQPSETTWKIMNPIVPSDNPTYITPSKATTKSSIEKKATAPSSTSTSATTKAVSKSTTTPSSTAAAATTTTTKSASKSKTAKPK